jgi:hypothetical protein
MSFRNTGIHLQSMDVFAAVRNKNLICLVTFTAHKVMFLLHYGCHSTLDLKIAHRNVTGNLHCSAYIIKSMRTRELHNFCSCTGCFLKP